VLDVEDAAACAAAVRALRPSAVIHLAGLVPPAPAWRLYRVNTAGTSNLLAALSAAGEACRVVVAGSAAELGPVPASRLPADESTPCRPADAYGLSKWAATRLTRAVTAPIEAIVVRPFNPVGPGMPAAQAFGRFARCLAAGQVLRVPAGAIEARRDFVDVRDVAAAFVAVLRSGRPGSVYHVGTGESRRIGEGLEILGRLAGTSARVEVEPGAARGGPAESRAGIERIAADTGWKPVVSFEQSLADLWASLAPGAGGRRVA
jgi:GDP-4-dehydro-6-deoxy-D-mannose reductase